MNYSLGLADAFAYLAAMLQSDTISVAEYSEAVRHLIA